MRSKALEELRATLRAFCPTGKELVSVPQLAEVLGLSTESEKQTLRGRLKELLHRGEVERVGCGRWAFSPDREPLRNSEAFIRSWRAIRIQPAGFCALDITMLAHVDRSAVTKYINWLFEEGFLAQVGRNGNTRLWRTTQKGQEQRKTPYPTTEVSPSYKQEREIAAKIYRALLLNDLSHETERKKIREHLAVLVERFSVTQNENATL